MFYASAEKLLYCFNSMCQCACSAPQTSSALALGMLNYCNYILTVSLYSFLLQTFTSHSKLSATVPAFVPREAYTGPTFPSNLVINSNLSPLVPEFKPSVSVTSYALPYKPGHHFQYPYHQSYIKQGKFNIKLQQVSQ